MKTYNILFGLLAVPVLIASSGRSPTTNWPMLGIGLSILIALILLCSKPAVESDSEDRDIWPIANFLLFLISFLCGAWALIISTCAWIGSRVVSWFTPVYYDPFGTMPLLSNWFYGIAGLALLLGWMAYAYSESNEAKGSGWC